MGSTGNTGYPGSTGRSSRSNTGRSSTGYPASPDALPYTPQRLQAMARVAIAIERGSFGSKEAVTQAQEATRLYPESPVTNFYLGEQLNLKQKKGAKEAYTKAATLGDDKVIAVAQERLKDLP